MERGNEREETNLISFFHFVNDIWDYFPSSFHWVRVSTAEEGEEKLYDLEKSKKLEKKEIMKKYWKKYWDFFRGLRELRKKLEKILICCRCGVGWGHENSDFFLFFFIFLSSEERMDGRKKKRGIGKMNLGEGRKKRGKKKLEKLLTIRAKSGQFLNIISFFLRGVETGIYTLRGGSKRVKEKRKKLQNQEEKIEKNLKTENLRHSPGRFDDNRSFTQQQTTRKKSTKCEKNLHVHRSYRRRSAAAGAYKFSKKKNCTNFEKWHWQRQRWRDERCEWGWKKCDRKKDEGDEKWGWKMIIFLLKEIIAEWSWLWGSAWGGRNEWSRQWNENEKKLDDFRMCRAMWRGSEGM